MNYKGIIFNVSSNIDFVRNSGSYRVATFLRDLNWDIEVIEWSQYFTLEELKELFLSRVDSNLKFCGFGTMFSFWNSTLNSFLDWIKLNYPDIIITIGGQSSQTIDANPHYFINGYAEKSIEAILEHHFSNSTEQLKLDSKWLDKNKKVIHYNYYPSAPLKSLLIKYENRDYIEKYERLTLEFSRGCIFECKFCSFPILGVKTDYSREASDLEIHLKDAYDRFGVTNYYVADETFNDSTKKLEKFSTVFNNLKFKPHLSGFIRADLLLSKSRSADKELLVSLGFFGQYYGIETFNHETGKLIGKGADPYKLKEGLLDLKKYFKSNGPYRGTIGMIVGLPNESVESVQNNANWLLDNWCDQNFLYWPLELAYNTFDDKMSFLSANKEKFKYTESLDTINETNLTVRTVNTRYNWANEHFNYNSAKLLSEEIYNKSINSGARLSNFELNKYMYYFNDINRVLQVRYSEVPELHHNVNNLFLSKINRYKKNKLNQIKRL